MSAKDSEASFEEYNVASMASKFIALEVSDHEDDYNSSVDSVDSNDRLADLVGTGAEIPEEGEGEEEMEMEAAEEAGIRAQSNALQGPIVITHQLPSTGVSSLLSSVTSLQSERKGKLEERKKWSFISTGSATTKKRWSTLSFASDSNSKGNRGISSASSNSSVQSISTGKPANSLKRSSTGASLRSLLNKISLSDTYANVCSNVSNNSSTQTTPSTLVVNGTPKDTMFSRSRQTSISSMSTYRTPLQPLSSSAHNRLQRSNISIDNVSISSQTTNSSLQSKWKFWKNLKPADEGRPHRSHQTPPSSVSSGTTSRSKSSFSDLRKALFASGPLSASAQELCRSAGSTLKHRLSHSSLKPMSSHSSLQTKASHSSLKKLRHGSNSEETPQISLPVPDQASRDKIRIKLKHSASLMSINSGSAFGNPIIAESQEYNEAVLNQILSLCDVKYIKDYSTLPKNLKKISTNHVYLDSVDDTVYKILPITSSEDSMTGKDLALKELQIQRLISGTPGFVHLLDSAVYQISDAGLQYVVFHMKNHGSALSNVTKLTFTEIQDIVAHCIRALYVAENKFNFEHRFLNLSHILLDKQGNITLCDYKLSRAGKGSNYWFTRLDHPLFFQSQRDYTYILQSMRYLMNSKSWHVYHPRTNLYWVHYIIKKLLGMCTEASPNRAKLVKLQANLDPLKRRRIWPRSDSCFENCGDILCYI